MQVDLNDFVLDQQVHNFVTEVSRLTKRIIAAIRNISYAPIIHISQEELHMKKLFGKFVSHSLTNHKN